MASKDRTAWQGHATVALRDFVISTTWSTAGKLPGPPTAFVANGNDLYASVRERGIFRSSDAGATWNQVYP